MQPPAGVAVAVVMNPDAPFLSVAEVKPPNEQPLLGGLPADPNAQKSAIVIGVAFVAHVPPPDRASPVTVTPRTVISLPAPFCKLIVILSE